jgi:hypothetical protein
MENAAESNDASLGARRLSKCCIGQGVVAKIFRGLDSEVKPQALRRWP